MDRTRFVASLAILAAAVFLLVACDQVAREENTSPPPTTAAAVDPVAISDPDTPTSSVADSDTRTLDLGGGVSLTLVYIPPGEFLMGSPSSEEGRDSDEGPQTRVRISKGFWMGETEVTQAQWEAVMGSNPSEFKGANLPVEMVSWDDAMDFCRKVSSRAGVTVTLPTEAQWEYACRAGTTTAYSFGSSSGNLGDYGWYSSNSGSSTHPVRSKRPNAFGLYDMHGNVWEWCSDWFGEYPGGSVTDPVGPNSGTFRVNRGGSWYNIPLILRAAYRYWITPGGRDGGLGFRVSSQD